MKTRHTESVRDTSPFFFIKKKDGKLRLVQDYQKINEWMVKNWYPLPLIPELITCVKGSSLFTKFDMWCVMDMSLSSISHD